MLIGAVATSFLEIMGVLFCIALLFGAICGCGKLWMIYDNMDTKVESLGHSIEDIYPRIHKLESDNIQRERSRG